MPNELGQVAFQLPGTMPGYEKYLPDLQRINPAYFQTMDKKVDYLNQQGMIPFIEVARRDIGQIWKKYYPWPESYARYIQYVWSRYQANNCLLSPIHFDTPSASIGVDDWNAAANLVLKKYGPPPFGTLRGTNSNPSSLRNWGHVDKAKWLDFHQIGNRRTHDVYAVPDRDFYDRTASTGDQRRTLLRRDGGRSARIRESGTLLPLGDVRQRAGRRIGWPHLWSRRLGRRTLEWRGRSRHQNIRSGK